MKGTLLRWLLTRHITGEYAESFKQMCTHKSKNPHEELGSTNIGKDQRDVQAIKDFVKEQ